MMAAHCHQVKLSLSSVRLIPPVRQPRQRRFMARALVLAGTSLVRPPRLGRVSVPNLIIIYKRQTTRVSQNQCVYE